MANKSSDNLFTSDRLIKDVETLMNSLFWIEALKAQNAKGISDSLKYQLSESEQFMKSFIEFTLNLKRYQLINILTKQATDQKKQSSSEKQTNLEHLFQNVITDKTDKDLYYFYLNNKHNNTSQEFHVVLPSQFLLECIFLTILDFNDYIATSSEIQTKLNDWFPEIRISSSHVKSIIESILNSNLCFKRLNNFTKSFSQKHKPIILGKRQYVWSVNQNFLKPFVRYFYKMYDKKTGCLINLDESAFSFDISSTTSFITIPLTSTNLKLNELDKLFNQKRLFNPSNELINLNEFNILFYSWRQKLDQFKLLMQIKHNSFGYSSSSDSISVPAISSQLDYIKQNKTNNKIKLKSNNRHNKIKRLNENDLKTSQTEIKITKIHLTTEFIQQQQQESLKETTINEQEQINQHDCTAYIEQNSNFENLLTNDDLSKLEESKTICVDSLVNSTHLMPNLPSNYFNLLPVSPTMCHSFFSHNEINVSHMLDANNDELFCDALNSDIPIQI